MVVYITAVDWTKPFCRDSPQSTIVFVCFVLSYSSFLADVVFFVALVSIWPVAFTIILPVEPVVDDRVQHYPKVYCYKVIAVPWNYPPFQRGCVFQVSCMTNERADIPISKRCRILGVQQQQQQQHSEPVALLRPAMSGYVQSGSLNHKLSGSTISKRQPVIKQVFICPIRCFLVCGSCGVCY